MFEFDTRGNVEEAGDGRSHRAYGAGNRLERKDNAECVWDAGGRLIERCDATPNGPKVWDPGHDDWVNVTMHPGETLAMGEPHANGFATTEAAIHSCGDSAKATAARLQINVDPKYGPRSTYGLYTFTKDTEVAYCLNTSANRLGGRQAIRGRRLAAVLHSGRHEVA